MSFSPPPLRSPLLDPQGLVTRTWQQWFDTLWRRTGGALDPVTPALIELSESSAPSALSMAALHDLRVDMASVQTEASGAVLRHRLEALELAQSGQDSLTATLAALSARLDAVHHETLLTGDRAFLTASEATLLALIAALTARIVELEALILLETGPAPVVPLYALEHGLALF